MSAENFLSTYVSVIAVLVIFIGAKLYYRNGSWVNTRTIDLDVDRRFYKEAEVTSAQIKNKIWVIRTVEGIWT
jgi:amino acid transporter